MKKILKLITTVLLSLSLIVSLTACSLKDDGANGGKVDNSQGGSYQDTITYIDRYVDGTVNTSSVTEKFENIEEAGYKAMTGGADKQAAVLREKILATKDTVKATGKTYYFSNNGSDNNDGLSEATPFSDIMSLNNLTLNPGDAVLFERDSVFRTSSPLTMVSGVSYGAYGEGRKPEIWGSEQNYAGKNLWKPYGDKKNFWIMDFTGSDAGVIVFDNGALEGRKYNSIILLREDGDYFHEQGNYIYLYSTKNPNEYNSIEIGCFRNIFNASGVSNVKIENIALRYSGAHGFQFVRATNIDITGCELSYIGGCYQATIGGQQYGNGIEFWGGSSNVTIKNCWVHKIFDAGITWQGNGDFTNFIIEENLIEYCLFSLETWGRPSAENNPTKLVKDIYFCNNISRFAGYSPSYDARADQGRAAHIQFGAGTYDYTDVMKNYVIENNIFDISDTYIYHLKWVEPFSKRIGTDLIIKNNTYYMNSRIKWQTALWFGSSSTMPNALTAVNQSELEAAVKVVDPTAKLVKWLG